MDTNTLITKIKDQDDKVRTEAWLGAGEVGAPAVKPLAAVMTDSDMEVARAAKRGLWRIVHHVGRPGADDEEKAVVAELIALLAGDDQPASVRREVLWMLSEIGGDEVVPHSVALLTDKDLREDARMALQRIPGGASVAALKSALTSAADDFKPNLAQSLRQRGQTVAGIPCQKLTPTKKTTVKPVGR